MKHIVLSRLTKLYLALVACLNVIMLIGCAKKIPTKTVIEEVCRQELQKSIKKKPLSNIEKRFFLDGRSRNILSYEDIHAQTFNEESSSATASRYVLDFGFEKPNGTQVRLLRSPQNGGMSLNGPNLASPMIRCKVVWSLFKGKAVRADLKVFWSAVDSSR